jgi:hypothetical protein
MLGSGIAGRCFMRTLLAVMVLVSLAGVVHAQAPIIIGPNGQYLGTLSANPYDPNSVANPYGRYGSRFSPDSINNPNGNGAHRTAPTR